MDIADLHRPSKFISIDKCANNTLGFCGREQDEIADNGPKGRRHKAEKETHLHHLVTATSNRKRNALFWLWISADLPHRQLMLS